MLTRLAGCPSGSEAGALGFGVSDCRVCGGWEGLGLRSRGFGGFGILLLCCCRDWGSKVNFFFGAFG